METHFYQDSDGRPYTHMIHEPDHKASKNQRIRVITVLPDRCGNASYHQDYKSARQAITDAMAAINAKRIHS